MKFSLKTAIAAITILALALGLFVIFKRGYVAEQTAALSFSIDQDFTVVRKVLVRKDGAKQIISMGGASEFVDQAWSDIDLGFDSFRLQKDWRINLEGTLTVRTLDDYIGRQVIELAQQVEVTEDLVDSNVKLVEGTDKLLDYAMRTKFARNEAGTTQVDLELRQKIHTAAPFFAASIANKRVRESAELMLSNQEQAIRQFIAEHEAEYQEAEYQEAEYGEEEPAAAADKSDDPEKTGPIRRLIKRLRDRAEPEAANP